jgi:GTPase
MSRIVAITGRPNVGKSTLFNRLTGTRDAIVEETSGVTRDRHYGKAEWNGVEFSLIDTGGIVSGSEDVFEQEILRQAEFAIEEADVILMLVDIMDGLHPLDNEVAGLLRASGKSVLLAANKSDTNERSYGAADFYSLGFGEVYPVSAINGAGTGELLDVLVDTIKHLPLEEIPDLPRFTVVGRPNVGKSSLINALLGKERAIVTPVAGTTRDSINIRYTSFGFDFYLVDTAGMRKKTVVKEDIEFYSVLRAVRAIENSDVCILMIDATRGFENQDQRIFHLIYKNHKALVIVVNKWDLVEKDTHTTKEFEEAIREQTAPFVDVPIIFTSVPDKQRLLKTLEKAMEVYNNRRKKISTSKLNEDLLPIIARTPPPAVKGKYVKVKYITQLPIHYPVFAFFANMPQYVKDPYKRFLENQLRKLYDFNGVPIEVYFRKK